MRKHFDKCRRFAEIPVLNLGSGVFEHEGCLNSLQVDSKAAARAMYLREAGWTHRNPRSVRLELCGLVVDENYPLMAASPNALITCSCCPDGVLQVKCSYKHRRTHPHDIPYRDKKYDLHYNRYLFIYLFLKFFVGHIHMSYFWSTGTPVLDFW